MKNLQRPTQLDRKGKGKSCRSLNAENVPCKFAAEGTVFRHIAISIFMPRVRHCVVCPKCGTRYVPGRSPYRNGSYLIPLIAHAAAGWILYCTCGVPSQWGPSELKPYEVSAPAYRRGYGTADEVWNITQLHDTR